eukprot:CAMPEP_0179196506 /NCGR_PEP_ID=MMETSP0796-20121207/97716_1 /TAXON_ID=73915 /ORGANISM="Pyrodinium bahamense, Strain pbaha01" /LENGTH=72 /DNA_ID=CAMNT_0020900921 /DNA_START=137 /DNA_END=351 /DNA_ORIENTATION=+
MFAYVVITHEHLEDAAQMRRLVSANVGGARYEGNEAGNPVSAGHKELEDIDSVDDVWAYIRDGILEAFIPEL